MIGTNKQEVRAFVERSIVNYKKSTDYAVIGAIPEAQQDFINGKLYDLYTDAERSSSQSTLQLLEEVLDEYPGFSSYFYNMSYVRNAQNTYTSNDECDYVKHPENDKFDWRYRMLNDC